MMVLPADIVPDQEVKEIFHTASNNDSISF